MNLKRLRKGYTLIELLVVIVVIGILSTMSTITFRDYQRRADNAVIISVIGQYVDALQRYKVVDGDDSFPAALTAGSHCLGEGYSGGDCWNGAASENVALNDALRPFLSDLPVVPYTLVGFLSGEMKGARFLRTDIATLDGESKPYLIQYMLKGENQDCRHGPIGLATGWPNVTTSTSGYTIGNWGGFGNTVCNLFLHD
jgi:prepilin-type N-terminal cleavage/methylation domain-containing protein